MYLYIRNLENQFLNSTTRTHKLNRLYCSQKLVTNVGINLSNNNIIKDISYHRYKKLIKQV